MDLTFDSLLKLLRKAVGDRDIASLISASDDGLNRDEEYGAIFFRSRGVEVGLQEAWLLDAVDASVAQNTQLVTAIHLYAAEDEEFSDYKEKLPGEIKFGDTEAQVRTALGPPILEGGGAGYIKALHMAIPRWLKYRIDSATMHCQFDQTGRLNAITLMSEHDDPVLSKK